jgi:anaerobic magnesium-protoporphyrin IX monomethyl ester cyclase
MRILVLNPTRRDAVTMVKEGRCMQRKGAWGYVMAPVTMVTMATLLRDDGHDVAVMDCPAEGTTFDAMLDAARDAAPDLLLVNTSTPTIDDDALAAAEVKRRSPKPVSTVLFGIHPSCRHDDLLYADSGVDACIVGEPELAARDVAAALAAGRGLEGVAGLALRAGDRGVVVTPPREPLADLDRLPIPDWSLVDTGAYRLPLNGRPFLLVNTNRGCPFQCTFCNAHLYYGRTPRRRSVAHVLAELRNDVERFGVRDFMFWAEELILDKPWVLELCDAIVRSGLDVRWVCNSRVDAVDAEVLAAVRRAGCWNVAFGIESGDAAALEAAHKQITLDQTRAAVALAKAAGLEVTGHVIVGLPGDTRASILATGDFVESLDLDFVQYYCAIPYPGTELWDRAKAGGWLTTSDWTRWEHNASVLDQPGLPAAEVMALRRKLMRRWYFAPRRAARIVRRHVRSPSDAWALASSMVGFVRWM